MLSVMLCENFGATEPGTWQPNQTIEFNPRDSNGGSTGNWGLL